MFYTCFVKCAGDDFFSITVILAGVAIASVTQLRATFAALLNRRIIKKDVLVPTEDGGIAYNDASVWADFESCAPLIEECGKSFRARSLKFIPLPPLDPGIASATAEIPYLGETIDNEKFVKESTSKPYTLSTMTFSPEKMVEITEEENKEDTARNKEFNSKIIAAAILLVIVLFGWLAFRNGSSTDEYDSGYTTFTANTNESASISEPSAYQEAGEGEGERGAATENCRGGQANSPSNSTANAETCNQSPAAETPVSNSKPSGPTRLSVSSNSLSFPAEGGTRSFTVSSDGDWYLSVNALDRVRVQKTSNGYTVSVGQNTSTSSFTDYIVVKAGVLTRRVDIYQSAGGCTRISASPSTVKLSQSSDYQYVDISHDGIESLSVSESASWITASVISSSRIKISSYSNYDRRRSGTVTVYCGNKSCKITVKQNGKKPCQSCGGNKRKTCPNEGRFWTDYNGSTHSYGYVNGYHVHRTVYMYMTYWGPQYSNSDIYCEQCGGNGYIECTRCASDGTVPDNW